MTVVNVSFQISFHIILYVLLLAEYFFLSKFLHSFSGRRRYIPHSPSLGVYLMVSASAHLFWFIDPVNSLGSSWVKVGYKGLIYRGSQKRNSVPLNGVG
jgi:hypothetical protein